MRASVFLTLSVVLSLLACSSTAIAPPRDVQRPSDTCIPDPAHDLMHCNGISRPWKDIGVRLICHPADQWEAFVESCP